MIGVPKDSNTPSLALRGGFFRVGLIDKGWIHCNGKSDAFLALRRLEGVGILEPTLELATCPGEED